MCLSRSSPQGDLVLRQTVQDQTGQAAVHKCQLRHVELSERHKMKHYLFSFYIIQNSFSLLCNETHRKSFIISVYYSRHKYWCPEYSTGTIVRPVISVIQQGCNNAHCWHSHCYCTSEFIQGMEQTTNQAMQIILNKSGSDFFWNPVNMQTRCS